jgi:hypothetical protein
MLLFGRAEFEPVFIHGRCHDLKRLFLLTEVYSYLDALKLRVEPKVSMLIGGEPKDLGSDIPAALAPVHASLSPLDLYRLRLNQSDTSIRL